MTLTARIRSNHPKPVCWQANKTTNSRVPNVDASSPSFASRMVQFIFQRKRRIADKRSQSWSGRPVPTAACHQVSANIAIPNGLTCSASSAVRSLETVRVRSQSQGAADSGYNEAQWRQLQSRCANCKRLFFTSFSSLSGAAGRFCSLDCKANLEYMHQLQEVMDAQTWESSVSTCEWTDEDEIEDEDGDVVFKPQEVMDAQTWESSVSTCEWTDEDEVEDEDEDGDGDGDVASDQQI